MLSKKIRSLTSDVQIILTAYEKLAKDDNDGVVNISTLKNLCVKLEPAFCHTNGSWRNFLKIISHSFIVIRALVLLN